MSEMGQLLINEVRRIAADNPDYVYPHVMCYYRGYGPTGSGSCIMGKALENLGLLARFTEMELGEGLSICAVLHELGVDLEPGENAWLDKVQAAQDGRSYDLWPYDLMEAGRKSYRLSWGDCVKYADGCYHK